MFQSAYSSIVSMAYGPQPTTTADVLKDISAISAHIVALKDAIEAYPVENGGVAAAMGIHAYSVNLSYAISTATTDVTNIAPVPVSDEDSQVILKAVEDLMPNIKTCVDAIVAKKSAFMALPAFAGVPAYIKHDLETLRTGTTELQVAAIEKTPAHLKEAATSLKDHIDELFAKAIAVYTDGPAPAA